MTTGYVFHPSYLLHNPGASHPESAARLESVMHYLSSTGLLDKLIKVEGRRATGDEISLVHTTKYQNKVTSMCASGGGSLDGDTVLSPESCDAAQYAVGGAIEAVEAVMGGRVGNWLRPGKAARPPCLPRFRFGVLRLQQHRHRR